MKLIWIKLDLGFYCIIALIIRNKHSKVCNIEAYDMILIEYLRNRDICE